MSVQNSANKIRSRLLIDTQNSFNKSVNSTMINSLTLKQFEEKMNQNLFIELTENYESPKNQEFIQIMKKLKEIDIDEKPLPLISIYKSISVSNLIGENQQKSLMQNDEITKFYCQNKRDISNKKMETFKIKNSLQTGIRQNSKRKNTITLESFQLKEDNLRGKNKESQEELIDNVINYLNKENSFFVNPKIFLRAKSSFFYLKSLCFRLKIELSCRDFDSVLKNKLKPNSNSKKEDKAFSEVENIMIIKENIDEKNILRRRSIDNRTILIDIINKRTENKESTKSLDLIKRSKNLNDSYENDHKSVNSNKEVKKVTILSEKEINCFVLNNQNNGVKLSEEKIISKNEKTQNYKKKRFSLFEPSNTLIFLKKCTEVEEDQDISIHSKPSSLNSDISSVSSEEEELKFEMRRGKSSSIINYIVDL